MKILAILRRKTSAIDYTSIYYFQATDTIRKGDIFRFDSGENVIHKDTQEYKSREEVE